METKPLELKAGTAYLAYVPQQPDLDEGDYYIDIYIRSITPSNETYKNLLEVYFMEDVMDKNLVYKVIHDQPISKTEEDYLDEVEGILHQGEDLSITTQVGHRIKIFYEISRMELPQTHTITTTLADHRELLDFLIENPEQVIRAIVQDARGKLTLFSTTSPHL